MAEASASVGSTIGIMVVQALTKFSDPSLAMTTMEVSVAWIATSTLILLTPVRGGHQL
jgi:hypothetical protein